MNTDDVLRELELMPMWKLRAKPAAIEVEKKPIIAALEKPAAEQTLSAPNMHYEITLSPDKQWAFIMEAIASEISTPADRIDTASQACTGMTESSGILFNNILHALRIEKPTKIQAQQLPQIDAKMIVAIGEKIAQQMLNSPNKLDDLRGKLHKVGNAQLLVIEDMAYLLANPLHKAKVWQDLCFAQIQLQNLHILD